MALNWLKNKMLAMVPFSQARFARFASLVGIKQNFLAELVIGGSYEVEIEPGMRVNMMSQGSRNDTLLVWKGFQFQDPYTKWFWLQLVRRVNMAVDIGCGHGEYALSALAANPSLTLHVIEPSAARIMALRENLDANPGMRNRCIIHPVAVSDRNSFSGLNAKHWQREENLQTPHPKREVYPVSLPFDQLDIGAPGIIHIGASHGHDEILTGMNRTLREHKPLIFLEVKDQEAFDRLVRLAGHWGYNWVQMDEHARRVEYPNLFPFRCGTYFLLFPPYKAYVIGELEEQQSSSHSIC